MMIAFESVLSGEDLIRALEEAASLPFVDGKATAGAAARAVKANEQARPDAAAGLIGFVHAALSRHAAFQAAAQVKRFGPVLVSRYRPGMTYGVHVDNPIMDGVRTDLSFTLFLSEPDAYDGGALRLDLPIGAQSVRLPAGGLLLYPTGALHEVEPVTRGERLAVVGWIQSRVRSPDARETLFDLANVRAALADGAADAHARLLLQKVEASLIRMWSE
jgi:PKHD-type hydroxylase